MTDVRVNVELLTLRCKEKMKIPSSYIHIQYKDFFLFIYITHSKLKVRLKE